MIETLQPHTRIIAGAVLLTVVGIAFGGWFLTRVVRGKVPMTDFQAAFARAGHAHAGVLVILSLVALLYADGLTGAIGWAARLGVPLAAALMSGGFFAASAGAGRTTPNRSIVILWLGAGCLIVGVIALGLALLLGAGG
ncbi:hypothetical protein [Actinoalloteichus hymeniacidonis]|uniref:Uncharacterized protein n=1 Tax=Actinoalloteichus hymeniacidonis TaxID=340345 RepID=A0AAC9HN13_9PSEU|nr:hypothetical protein [Actinoalloteichus hymeniacidonis]AOS62245.1 hypothetical protein TL08_07130 [Actinoalloteichus hymeniacidonis]MBB5909729.1 hypothetical protein [Actinoalloteichus hymeniacidonis]